IAVWNRRPGEPDSDEIPTDGAGCGRAEEDAFGQVPRDDVPRSRGAPADRQADRSPRLDSGKVTERQRATRVRPDEVSLDQSACDLTVTLTDQDSRGVVAAGNHVAGSG